MQSFFVFGGNGTRVKLNIKLNILIANFLCVGLGGFKAQRRIFFKMG